MERHNPRMTQSHVACCQSVQGLRGWPTGLPHCTWLPPLGGWPPGHVEGLNTGPGVAGSICALGPPWHLAGCLLDWKRSTTWAVGRTTLRGGRRWACARLSRPRPSPYTPGGCQGQVTEQPATSSPARAVQLLGCPVTVQGHKRELRDLKRKHSLTEFRWRRP